MILFQVVPEVISSKVSPEMTLCPAVMGLINIDGGSEIDFVSYAEYSSTVVVDFENSTASAGGATDTLSGIEGVIGGSGDDSLIGHDSVDNIFRPGAGNDSISGGSTVDELDYSQREVGVSIDMNSGSAALYEGAEVDSI